jgi:hypothetical protein
MSNSFGAVSFDVLWDNPFTTPTPPRRHTLSVRKAPWGSRTVVQDLGREATEDSYRIELSPTAYTTLEGLIGTQATRTIEGDGARSGVLLQELSGVEKDPTHSLVTCTASFLVP